MNTLAAVTAPRRCRTTGQASAIAANTQKRRCAVAAGPFRTGLTGVRVWRVLPAAIRILAPYPRRFRLPAVLTVGMRRLLRLAVDLFIVVVPVPRRPLGPSPVSRIASRHDALHSWCVVRPATVDRWRPAGSIWNGRPTKREKAPLRPGGAPLRLRLNGPASVPPRDPAWRRIDINRLCRARSTVASLV